MRHSTDLDVDSGKFMQRVHAILDPDHSGLLNEAQNRFFRTTSIEVEKFETLERDNPILRLVNHIGNYWRHSILVMLSTESYRPSTLVKLLKALDPARPISQRMLCLNLRILQRDGLVARQLVDARVKHVQYSLTPLGDQLVKQLMPLLDWIIEHAGEVTAAREAFDAEEEELH